MFDVVYFLIIICGWFAVDDLIHLVVLKQIVSLTQLYTHIYVHMRPLIWLIYIFSITHQRTESYMQSLTRGRCFGRCPI